MWNIETEVNIEIEKQKNWLDFAPLRQSTVLYYTVHNVNLFLAKSESPWESFSS